MPQTDITDQQRRFLALAHERLGGWSNLDDPDLLNPLLQRGLLEYVEHPVTRVPTPRITAAGCAALGQTNWLL